jgi:mono/diheme cytochrome c family protein
MKSLLRLTFAVVCTLVALTAVASAQVTTPNGGERWKALTNGGYAYELYCAQCHGPDGTGNGPLAKKERLPVPDLTTVGARNGGFDKAKVMEHIFATNRQARPGMPAWGAYLRTTSQQSDAYALLAAHNVMRHVEALQQSTLLASRR